MGCIGATRVCYDDPGRTGNPLRPVVCGYLSSSSDDSDGAGAVHDEAFGGHPVTRVERGSSPADFLALVSTLSSGDVLVVPSLVHVGLSIRRTLAAIASMESAGVRFVSVAEGVDTATPDVSRSLAVMRSILDAERRLMARRRSDAAETGPEGDQALERSRKVMGPWIGEVLEHRPALTWERLVERLERSGRGSAVLSAPSMRRHARRLVDAGDLPVSVMDRAQRPGPAPDAVTRARELAASVPRPSLREIAKMLEEEGVMPPRAEAWSATTVRRLLED